MSIATEPETLGELIADCALIPSSLVTETPAVPPQAARPWTVDDTCQAQVAEYDAYI
ncbi:hypothetical protein [Amycolatopsis sp. CA-230715]|uniref:hypothetical protein n=1 Tax=Amycolatopsis sp. CA-230715 TaxID=2745196 RepID=UPI001C010E10|nr:hypothetical protein [Amycolatopsis sp. CA-230715]QWF78179.1 hypothetical protein HUW46_01574 [Amycolatopsis sp. CA-230715]